MSILHSGALEIGRGTSRPVSATTIIRQAQIVGAAGASENPTRLCEPSQNGLVAELPQRHNFTSGAGDPSLRGGIGRSLPSGPTTRTGPSTKSGPFILGVIMTSVMGTSWGKYDIAAMRQDPPQGRRHCAARGARLAPFVSRCIPVLALTTAAIASPLGGQSARSIEGGELMAYHGHTSQVEFRFTNLWEERLGADIALAAFPESFGTEALLFLGDLDATRPVQV